MYNVGLTSKAPEKIVSESTESGHTYTVSLELWQTAFKFQRQVRDFRLAKNGYAKVLKIAVFDNPTVVWCPSPGNPREYPHRPYIAINYSHLSTSSTLTECIYFHFNFHGGLRQRMYFETECAITIQAITSKSLILVPIESAYATSS